MWDQTVLSLNLVADESWGLVVMQRRQTSSADSRFLTSKIMSNGKKQEKLISEFLSTANSVQMFYS
jgi:hypothetical protein